MSILTACNPGMNATMLSTLTRPPAISTTSVQSSPTKLPPTNTKLSPSSTNTPTLAPTRTTPPSSTPVPPTLTSTATADPFPGLILPDLQTLPPTDLRLLYNPESGRALVRFSNSIWNSGPGVLELIGISNQAKDQIKVSQRIYADDPEFIEEFEVGEFTFHEEHDHWHLERFAVYEVWSVDERGDLKEMVSEGRKISYCVLDTSQVRADLFEGAINERQQYTHCEGELQGLSVGWVDTYEDHLPGQWVEITPLNDGFYALVSTVNPDQLINEANLDNNTAVLYFEIQDLRLKILEDDFFNRGIF